MTDPVPTAAPRQTVIVTDVDIPFMSMVALIFKFTLASIPALIMLTILSALAMGVLGGIGMALNSAYK